MKKVSVDFVNMISVVDNNETGDDERRGMKRKMSLSRSDTLIQTQKHHVNTETLTIYCLY